MGLRDRRSTLLDLTYPAGQGPLVVTPMPTGSTPNPVVSPVDASARDALRITRWLASPAGVVFSLKQAAMQRMNPKIDGLGDRNRIWTPLKTIAQVAGAAAGLHLTRHGALTLDEPGYLIARLNERGNPAAGSPLTRTLARVQANPNAAVVEPYNGGPNSVMGLGTTVIHRYQSLGIVRLERNRYSDATTYMASMQGWQTDEKKSNLVTSITLYRKELELARQKYTADQPYYLQKPREDVSQNPLVVSAEAINDDLRKRFPSSTTPAVDTYSVQSFERSSETVYGLGAPLLQIDTVQTGRKSNDNTIGELGPFRAKSINEPGPNAAWLNELHDVVQPTAEQLAKATRDLVPLHFELIDNDHPAENVFLVFRSTITGFVDSYVPSWTPIRYNGRGESFYVYEQTIRQISFNFRCAAESAEGLRAMQTKINALAASTFGDYDALRMRGSMQRLTIGDWLTSQPGFITSLTLTPLDDAPWETDRTRGYILPKVVDVTVTFTPIHDFLPRKSLYRSKLVLPIDDEKMTGLRWTVPLRTMETRKRAGSKQTAQVEEENLEWKSSIGNSAVVSNLYRQFNKQFA